MGNLFTSRSWAVLASTIALLAVTPGASGSNGPLVRPDALGIGTSFSRWPGGVVEYVYNPTGVPAEFADNDHFLNQLVGAAVAELEGVSGLHFVFQGVDAGAVPTDYSDGLVVIAWDDIGGAGGIAEPVSACTAQEKTDEGYCPYKDGRLRLNNNPANFDWNSSGDVDTREALLVQVLTHELIHLVGLGHSDKQVSIMYADPYNNLNHVRDDDIDALQSLYGPPDLLVTPATYAPPASAASPFDSTILSSSDQPDVELTQIDDAESSFLLGLKYTITGPFSGTVALTAVDPGGYYYKRSFQSVSCPDSVICSGWFSVAQTELVKTYAGEWTFYLISEGSSVATHLLNVNTNPTSNARPDSFLAIAKTRGVRPFSTYSRLSVLGDAEGDNVDSTWHVPGAGETPVDFGGSTGESHQTLTFDTEGEYEVYVEVNDDWARYGVPNTGTEAGPGFRQLYRRIVTVDRTLTTAVGVADANFDGAGDIAVLLENSGGVSNRLMILDGTDGSTIAEHSLGDSGLSVKELRSVPDMNGDAVPDVATVARDLDQGGAFIEIWDALTAAKVKRIVYEAAYEPLGMVVVPGVGAGLGLGVLGRDGDGRIRVQLKDASSGALISKVFFDPAYAPQAVEVLASIDGDGVPDIAVLGVDPAGRVRAQIKDAVSGTLESLVYFDKRYVPVAFRGGLDLDHSEVPDIVVLGVDAEGRFRAQVKDAATGNRTGLVAFQKGLEFRGFVVVPDVGSPSLGVLGRDTSSGFTRVQLKNAVTGALETIVRFDSANLPRAVTVVPDTDGGGFSDIAVLGFTANGAGRLQMKDAQSAAPRLYKTLP